MPTKMSNLKKKTSRSKIVKVEFVVERVKEVDHDARFQAAKMIHFQNGKTKLESIHQLPRSRHQVNCEKKLVEWLQNGQKMEHKTIVSKFDEKGEKKLEAFE